jgi:uncharacterized membrane protein YidH (DUF202 family)
VIRGALLRLGQLLLVAGGASGLAGLALGAGLGAGAARGVSVAWYAVGALLLFLGVAVSSRGPVRNLRWATRSEQDEALNVSAVLVALGFVLLVLGAAVDPHRSLF